MPLLTNQPAKRDIDDLMPDDTPSPTAVLPYFIQVTAYVKKLEDARLAVNHLVGKRCAHHKDLLTQQQSLADMEERMATEKESTMEKEEKEFEERQEAARKRHKMRKTGLINSISIRYHAERLELDKGLRTLQAETSDVFAKEKTARKVYRQAEIECTVEMTKGQTELEKKVALKRTRDASPANTLPSDRENSPLTGSVSNMMDEEWDALDCFERSSPRRRKIRPPPGREIIDSVFLQYQY